MANLLSLALVEFVMVDEVYATPTGSAVAIANAMIYAPIADYDRLRVLSMEDNKLILAAVQEIWPNGEQEGDIAINEVGYRLNPELLADTTGNTEELLAQLEKEGLQNPNPHTDLWDWYGKWSSGDLPTYQSRREYIRGLFGPLEARLRKGPQARGAEVFSEPTGWPRVDRTLGQVRNQLESASIEEQFQTVGLLCRETLISLAQTVLDPDQHRPHDGVDASETDAKRMLDSYLAVEVGGKSDTIARKYTKAALDLAAELQQRRTAAYRDHRTLRRLHQVFASALTCHQSPSETGSV